MTSDEMRAAAAVMIAAADGKKIEVRPVGLRTWGDVSDPKWSWRESEYRVKPEPTELTVMEQLDRLQWSTEPDVVRQLIGVCRNMQAKIDAMESQLKSVATPSGVEEQTK